MKRALVKVLVLMSPAIAQTEDPFQPYLDGAAPPIVREVSTETSKDGQVVIRKLVYEARQITNDDGARNDSNVYAVIARPAKAGKYPGMLVLHGGAGQADEGRAIAWARHGYIAIAPDLPGIAEPKNLKHTTGPALQPYGRDRFKVQPDVTASSIFEAVVAAIRAFDLLAAQPDTDADNIGVTGISWGGYTSTMVCSLLGDRVKAGFSLYGSGFYEDCTFNNQLKKLNEEDRATWIKYLDAGRRADRMKSHFFIAAATNDTFFFPPAISKTLAAIPANDNHLFSPNDDHACRVPGGNKEKDPVGFTGIEQIYFDHLLRNIGDPLPRIVSPTTEVNGNEIVATFSVERVSAPLTDISVWYTTPGTWKSLKWKHAKATQLSDQDHRYVATLPVEGPATIWFALVSDNRRVTVSSSMSRAQTSSQ